MFSYFCSKLLLFLAVLSMTSFAQAGVCKPEVRANLLQALHNMALDPKHPVDNQKKAATAIGLIRVHMQIDCELKPFQREGLQMEVDTSSHHISVFLFAGKIIALDLKSKRLN